MTDEKTPHIDDEKAYREQIRQEVEQHYTLENKPRKKKLSKSAWILIILFFIFFVIPSALVFPFVFFGNHTSSSNTIPQDLHKMTGTFADYNYVIVDNPDGNYPNQRTATFTPVLPADTTVMNEAMKAIIQRTTTGRTFYKEPTLVAVNENVNAYMFEGENSTENFYLIPIKEDTGKIRSIIFWIQ